MKLGLVIYCTPHVLAHDDDIYHYYSDFTTSDTWLVMNSKLGNQANTKMDF